MAAEAAAVSPEEARYRFIPFRRADLFDMLVAEDALSTQDREVFLGAARAVQAHFREDFNDLKQSLKNAYAPLDPDADTRFLHSREEAGLSTDFSEALERVLQRANYDKVTDKGLQKALRTSSLFQVRLFVNLKDYEEVLLYTRGASRRSETLSEFFGLWKRKVRFTNFERVVLYLRIRPDMDSEGVLMHCPPGRTMIKLFQNVPEADLEMLFPNIRVGMRFIDKLMIGVPAVVSGAVVFSTKMGATLLLLGSLIGFWLGMSVEPVELDKAALLALAAGIGALGGYLWKQYANFRNRKLKYTQALTENLYFKLLDNNAGVFHRVLDDAEESECKESLLALYFLLRAREPVTSAELDQAIERWFEERWHCSIDFEIADALGKLERLGMAAEQEGRWRPLREAATGPAAA